MGPGTSDWVLDYVQFCPEDNWLAPIWWSKLRSDTTFLKQSKVRWQELRSGLLSNDRLHACIDGLVAELGPAKDRNFERWPIQAEYVWPNAYVGNTYENDLEYLKDWLIARLSWMDAQIDDFGEPRYRSADYFDPIAFPNPSDLFVNFEYYVRDYEDVSIYIYNSQGQLVTMLEDREHPNGKGRLTWEHSGNSFGLYFYGIYFNDKKIKTGSIFCNK